MSKYLQRYVGTYRVIADYDISKNDFPRITEGCHKGEIDPSFDDIYIKCKSGVKIYHYGKSILITYIPSLGRGHNIIKSIYNDIIGDVQSLCNDYKTIYKRLNDNGIIFDIEDTDEEVLFKFKAKDIEQIEKYLKPSINGASKSPFAKINLSHTKYEIPLEDLTQYKEITSVIAKDDISVYSKINDAFIANLASKKYTSDDIIADMKVKGLSGKNYFHSIGKWQQYLDFTKDYIDNKYKTI